MFVYLRANGSEVQKQKHPSFHALEKGGCIWWGWCLAICEWRQDTYAGCLGSPQTSWLHKGELKGFLWEGCVIWALVHIFNKMRHMLIAACFPIQPRSTTASFTYLFPLPFSSPHLPFPPIVLRSVFKELAWLIGIRAKGASFAWTVLPGIKRNGLLWRLLRIFGLITFVLIFSLVSDH